jgi:hypothetical protein
MSTSRSGLIYPRGEGDDKPALQLSLINHKEQIMNIIRPCKNSSHTNSPISGQSQRGENRNGVVNIRIKTMKPFRSPQEMLHPLDTGLGI